MSQKDTITNILEASQEQFGQFGFAKTTMTDIATHLGLSKASLYYYFPDKEMLFTSVVEKEQKDFIGLMQGLISKDDDIEKILTGIALLHLKYFSKLINLAKLKASEYCEMPGMKELRNKLRKAELALIIDLLKSGVNNKKVRIDDFNKVASLFLDSMIGLRMIHLKRSSNFIFTPTELKNLEKQIKEFVHIFINGIKK